MCRGIWRVGAEHRMDGGAEDARLLDLGHRVERAHGAHRIRRPDFEDRPRFEDGS